MSVVVCPERIVTVFRHLIKVFCYELNISRIETDVNVILSLRDEKVILFGAQELCKYYGYSMFLKSNSVYLYNTEQLQSGVWDYFINLSCGVKEWWDYSNVNISYLTRFNYTCKHVPFLYSKALELDLSERLNKDKITFFGTHHPRREEICNRLRNMEIDVEYNISGTLVDKEYDDYIRENGVYVNIHYYTPSILEIVRITPLLSQGHFVISERSDDKELDALFGDCVVWLDDIFTKGKEWLSSKIREHNNKEMKEKFSRIEINLKNLI